MQSGISWLVATVLQGGWAPATVFLIHVIASKVCSLYERWPGFDVPMHLLGGVAIAYFWHTASLAGSTRGLLATWHPLTHGLLVFGWTAVATVVWEFAEFTSDRYLGTNAQGNNLTDTLKDILLGLVGGVCLTIGACVFYCKNPPKNPGES